MYMGRVRHVTPDANLNPKSETRNPKPNIGGVRDVTADAEVHEGPRRRHG